MITIDRTKTKFKSKNHTYTILPIQMCYERLKRFRNDQTKVFYGLALDDLVHFIFSLRQQMSTGDDVSFKTSYMELYNQIDQFCKPLEGKRVNDLYDNAMEDVLRMCSYFIVREGEKMHEYDERIAEEKIQDWKDNFSWFDFFFLAQQQSKSLREQLQDTILKTK